MQFTDRKTTPAGQQNVERTAYLLWNDAGCPAGRDLEFWLAAEAKLHSAPSAPTQLSFPAKSNRTSSNSQGESAPPRGSSLRAPGARTRR